MPKKIAPLTLVISAKEDPSVDSKIKSLTVKLTGAGEASRAATVQAQAHAKALKEDADAADKLAKEATKAAKAMEGNDGKEARKAATALREQAKEAQEAARAAEKVASDLDKIHVDKIKEAEREFKSLVATEKQAQNELKKIGDSTPHVSSLRAFEGGLRGIQNQAVAVRAAMANIRNAGDGGKYDPGVLSAGAHAASGMKETLGGVRDAGAGAAVVGVLGIQRSEALRKMGSDAVESENLVKQSFGESTAEIEKWSLNLQSSLGLNGYELRKQAGYFNLMFTAMQMGDAPARNMSKSLTELAGDMASMYNMSTDDAFTKLKAGIVGETEPLRSIGVILTEATTQQYAYSHGIAAVGDELTEQQKVLARYGQIMEQTKSAQGDLSRTMDSPENIRRRTQALGELAAIEIGKGSASAQASIDNMKASLLQIVGMSPALAQGAGYIGTWGSYALAGVGGLTAFGAQLGQLFLGWQALNAAAAKAKLAKIADAEAAVAAAAANQSLTAAELEAAAAADAQSAAMGRTQLASLGIVGGIAAIVTAIGVWALSGIYNINQVNLKLEEQRTLLESVQDGWNAIKDSFTGGNTAAQGVTQRQLEKSIAQVDAEKAESVLKGKNQEQADKEAIEKKRVLYEKFAKEQLRTGDKENMVANQQKAAQLKQQQDAASATASLPTLAGAGIPSATPATGTTTATGGTVAGALPDGATGSGAAPSSEGYTQAIRALEDEKSNTTNRVKKKDLTNQIRNLRRQQQDAKKAEAAQKKADAKAEREAKRAEKEQDKDDLALAKAESDIAASERIEKLNDELEAAREANNAAEVGRLTFEIETQKAEKEYQDNMAAAAQEEAGKHRTTLEKIARMKFEADQNRAQIAGRKAENAIEKSGGSGKSKPLTDAQKRAVFNATGGTQTSLFRGYATESLAGGNALNPAGSATTGRDVYDLSGKRIESETDKRYDGWHVGGEWNGQSIPMLASLYTGGNSATTMTQGVPGSGDFTGRGNRSTGNSERMARVQSIRENNRGRMVIKFEDLEIDTGQQLHEIPVD